MSSKASEIGVGLPPMPSLDFSAFGEVEVTRLSRVQAFGGRFLHRNWLSIPHVTHHDNADITALEDHREALNRGASETRVTPLAYQVKAVVAALAEMPRFNASLNAESGELILKKYFNIGIAVDTPAGLLVPVLRNCDRKSVAEIAAEITAVSARARDRGLAPDEMSGGCFTISSVGSIGGTSFTPIINAPEVAILGVSRAEWQPRRDDDALVWRLMLPLSLSYDHRVINGADAARFVRCVADHLALAETL